MAAGSELTIKVHIDGIHQTLAALSKLPKDAGDELRNAALDLSKELANAVKANGAQEGRQAALVAKTVKARRDRVPVVVAGGNRKLGSNKAPAYKLLFGSEFGADRYTQFRPHLGRGSYWFFRTIEEEQVEIAERWMQAADDIVQKFGEAG